MLLALANEDAGSAYSITSSAIASMSRGLATPSVRAV